MTADEEHRTHIDILKARHQELDDWVDNMSTRRYITPTEHKELRLAKVKRLRLREMIERLGNEEASWDT